MKNTFIEEAKIRGYKVWFNEFPTLKESKFAQIRATFSKYFNLPVKTRIERLNEVYEYSVSSLSSIIRAMEQNDLVLYYTSLIDLANHMFYKPGNIKLMMTLATYYRKFAHDLAAHLSVLPDNIAVLIVSDHGYDPQAHDHSFYGFWSINVQPPRKPKTILDFKNLILSLLER